MSPNPEDTTPVSAYDALASTYDEHEADPYCVDLEFPAMQELLPDVAGKRILDAGCGSGRYTEWLLEEGAEVVAVDASEAMISLARERVGDRSTVQQADLTAPLSFDDATFDGVVSGLALHYLPDWRPVFAEFARVLAPGGFLAFSAHHPVDDFLAYDDVTYFETEPRVMTWQGVDGDVEVPFYSRPFSAVVNPLLDAGFGLDEVVEPKPRESFREKRPQSYEKRLSQPTFLCVLATKTKSTGVAG